MTSNPMKQFAFEVDKELSAMVMGRMDATGVKVSAYYDAGKLGQDNFAIRFYDKPQIMPFNDAYDAAQMGLKIQEAPSQRHEFGPDATAKSVARFLKPLIEQDLLPPEAASFVMNAFKTHCHQRAFNARNTLAIETLGPALQKEITAADDVLIRIAGEVRRGSNKAVLKLNTLQLNDVPHEKATVLAALSDTISRTLS